MEIGGEPADVPAVAHSDQRQHRDLGVLCGVQGTEHRLLRILLFLLLDAGSCARARRSVTTCHRRGPRRCWRPGMHPTGGHAGSERIGVELEPQRLRGETGFGQIERDEV